MIEASDIHGINELSKDDLKKELKSLLDNPQIPYQTFEFNIQTCSSPEVELIQLITKCVESYTSNPHQSPTDLMSVFKYFHSMYVD